MKTLFALVLFLGFNVTTHAQFYYNFDEAKSFYNKTPLLQSSAFQKEVLVIKQKKGGELVDSFKILIYTYNNQGNIISAYRGSKWTKPAIIDSFIYDDAGNRTRLEMKYPDVQDNRDYANNEPDVEAGPAFKSVSIRYEYDSVNKVKKVFNRLLGAPEKLSRLIYYDDQNRITKIDLAPESLAVYYKEYVYKKNKLKIYTNTSITRDCYEIMKFNDNGQIGQREVTIKYATSIALVDYNNTYYSDGLLYTETKQQNGSVFTVVTHYYYKN